MFLYIDKVFNPDKNILWRLKLQQEGHVFNLRKDFLGIRS